MAGNKDKVKRIDVTNETCPVPLVETRKAILKASPGEVIEISGDHPASKKEIPMALEEMGVKILNVEEKGGIWKIKFKVS
ncbi:MAG: sulfurtransferase TusA family protein [Thermoproteota archaeon]